ncbi:TetR/AcrR family transcriptional regulator [Rouxiella chamberiensis]|uniref:TetR/AcrR family transcriptional regulator n=1 Tax=Rouxiella chamberiensis TaxID=1513468 RepID=A0ABY7HMH3_9GAMM|nr:TetR/AcrR family transcriptional regulator [Rouxiella chamberiensis]WAT00553.1 TetR/AcrR family transcriptional regulator [Rouxiella chamberiensis]
MKSEKPVVLPQRGPALHERREQIICAALDHFRHYGYSKTSVADLAKAIGVSSAYVYKFFESKQAIGEAVCSHSLGQIDDALRDIAASNQSAAARLRELFSSLLTKSLALFFEERKLHDIAAVAVSNHWDSAKNHRVALYGILKQVIIDGRDSGEFESETPLEEVCMAIASVMTPFSHPLMLEEKTPEQLKERVIVITNLVLRSLTK